MTCSVRTVPLTKNKVALVDAEDYESVAQWKWYAMEMKSGYFQAARFARIDGRKVCIYMHREILGLMPGDARRGDHKEPANTLDNRRSNLRIATVSQNGMNRGKQRNNKSGMKGVSWDKKRGAWVAQIALNRKHYFLGYFDTPQAAHDAYCDAANRHHGEFARTQ